METRFTDWKYPWFNMKGDTKYGWRCSHPEHLKLGKNTDIGYGTYLMSKYGIEIGENTQIGGNCLVYSKNTENETQGPVTIGRDCLIGSFCLILPNSRIPDGARMKAYSIWSKSGLVETWRSKVK